MREAPRGGTRRGAADHDGARTRRERARRRRLVDKGHVAHGAVGAVVAQDLPRHPMGRGGVAGGHMMGMGGVCPRAQRTLVSVHATSTLMSRIEPVQMCSHSHLPLHSHIGA